jgi:type IV secretory pathway VirB10-like protein
MDILAGMLAYIAGIGVFFAGLAVSFSVFVATPDKPIEPQSATAMLVKPSTPSKAVAAEAGAKPPSGHAEKNAAANSPADAARPTRLGNETHRRPDTSAATSAAQLRQMVEEERARRWASQHDPSFEHRFLGYAD